MTDDDIKELAFNEGLWDVFDGEDCYNLKAVKRVITYVIEKERKRIINLIKGDETND